MAPGVVRATIYRSAPAVEGGDGGKNDDCHQFLWLQRWTRPFSTAYSGFIVDFCEDSGDRDSGREAFLLFSGQKEAARQASHSARLLSFALALSCLLLFFSTPSVQAGQRTPGSLAVSPRVDLLSEAPWPARTQCHGLSCLAKAHVAHLSTASDMQALPAAMSLPLPERRGAPIPASTGPVSRMTAAALSARGPPA